jgi:predicted signal transduction protein with EAL and GGDEF domain
MEQTDRGLPADRGLHDLGVRLAHDDFGTGYASHAYQRHLPLDALKIDRSFVAELGDGPADAIVEAVIRMAHGLGIETIAEGIEAAAQADRLRELGCDRAQGFAFARPAPANEIEPLPGKRLSAPEPPTGAGRTTAGAHPRSRPARSRSDAPPGRRRRADATARTGGRPADGGRRGD